VPDFFERSEVMLLSRVGGVFKPPGHERGKKNEPAEVRTARHSIDAKAAPGVSPGLLDSQGR
jgi:hypothetical protein